MAGYIEDRWLKKRPNKETGKRERTTLYGSNTKRYRVCGIPGVRRKSFETIDAAKRWKAKAEHETNTGDFLDPARGAMTLRTYIRTEYLPNRPSGDPGTAATVRSRLDHVDTLLGDQRLAALKAPELRGFIKDLEPRLGPATTHEVWGYLSAVLQHAVDDERIRKNPCKTKTVVLPVVPERRVQPWARDRIRLVRASLAPRYRATVDVGVGVGMRQGEVFGLAEGDIDDAAEVIHVRRQVKKLGAKLVFALPKGQKTRTVPASAHVRRRLREHIAAFPPVEITLPWGDSAPPQTERDTKERAPQTYRLLFTTPSGTALRRDSWNLRQWKPALAAAGVIPPPETVRQGKRQRPVKKYAEAREDGFHVLRHTFASVQLHARETIVAVSKWLGHKDPAITLRIYAHMMPEADGRGRAAMDDWFQDL
ncbi:tyrosine-type recombinase/integrase [Streptomyces iconiensis]|uniref:Site-specific integrase n=1 Tax=Streptomyces iconiensis TaxID=1384038 RepID=A0ABT6ZTN6_9ACTN|nr:site-specific integrase [Streptomyces iconiensis]MDJ1132430.1 site-specific integrase [Streptomyces iconiensis]